MKLNRINKINQLYLQNQNRIIFAIDNFGYVPDIYTYLYSRQTILNNLRLKR